jgi:hypothetical protein
VSMRRQGCKDRTESFANTSRWQMFRRRTIRREDNMAGISSEGLPPPEPPGELRQAQRLKNLGLICIRNMRRGLRPCAGWCHLAKIAGGAIIVISPSSNR